MGQRAEYCGFAWARSVETGDLKRRGLMARAATRAAAGAPHAASTSLARWTSASSGARAGKPNTLSASQLAGPRTAPWTGWSEAGLAACWPLAGGPGLLAASRLLHHVLLDTYCIENR